MRLRKHFVAIFMFVLAGSAYGAVDLEFPLKTVFACTDIEETKNLNGNYSDTFLCNIPVPFAGPFRAQYIFTPESFSKKNTSEVEKINSEKSNFFIGAGVSSYFWPFQTLAFSSSFTWKFYTLKNGNSLELENILDAGILHFPESYFDAEKGNRVTKHNFSGALEYGLNLNYRWNGKFAGYIGAGPGIAVAKPGNDFLILYSFNINLGYRLFNN